jgi:hypothetical protein
LIRPLRTGFRRIRQVLEAATVMRGRERVAALARDASQSLITGLGDLRDVIRDAGAAEKAAIYEQLGLKVTVKPGKTNSEPKFPSARSDSRHTQDNMVIGVVSEGDLNTESGAITPDRLRIPRAYLCSDAQLPRARLHP